MPEVPEKEWQKLFRQILAEVAVLAVKAHGNLMTTEQFTEQFLERRKEIFSIVENEVIAERFRIKEIVRSHKKTAQKVNGKLSLRAEENRNGNNQAIESILSKI